MKCKLLLFSFLFLTIGNLLPGHLASQQPPLAGVEIRSILFTPRATYGADSARHGLLKPVLLEEQRLSSGRSFWLFPAIGAGLGAAILTIDLLASDCCDGAQSPLIIPFIAASGALAGGLVGLGVEVVVRASEG